MIEAKLQPTGAEGYLMNLRESLKQGLDSPRPEVRGAVRELILELCAEIRDESADSREHRPTLCDPLLCGT